VVFTTTSRLLDGDKNDGPDIYLYTDGPDPANESNLTLVTDTGDVPGLVGPGTNVVGSSDDASRIYFWRNEEFYLWEEGEKKFIASRMLYGPVEEGHFAATTQYGGTARVSPDGRFLAFLPREGGMYVYDAENDALSCASCDSDGGLGGAQVVPDVTKIWPKGSVPAIRPSFLANDGNVFFSTSNPLVERDTNGVTDAYQFDPSSGKPSLLSTGDSPLPAAFAEAGTDGETVFFVTRESLLGADRDTLVDIYAARVGGGFPKPPQSPAPCDGDACRGTPALPPGRPVTSSTGEGAPNPDCRRSRRCRCAKKRRAAGKQKPRCAKPKHKKSNRRHRAAGTTRRAAR
jgi:hypothetical protein